MTTGGALRHLIRPPNRRRLVLLAVGAFVVATACWYFGIDTAHAVAIGVVLLAIGIVWIATPQYDAPDWDEHPPVLGDGVRQDVARLSWSLRSRNGGVAAGGLRRVQQLARHRLARFGLDLDAPADREIVERMLGHAAYAVLRPEGHDPRPAAVAACLDAIEAIGTPETAVRRDDRAGHPGHPAHRVRVRILPAFVASIASVASIARRTRHDR